MIPTFYLIKAYLIDVADVCRSKRHKLKIRQGLENGENRLNGAACLKNRLDSTDGVPPEEVQQGKQLLGYG